MDLCENEGKLSQVLVVAEIFLPITECGPKAILILLGKRFEGKRFRA
jgi:hypothetical protein